MKINCRPATPPLKTDLMRILTRKLRHASSFSFECTDFKNVIFENIHWAHSEDAEVVEVKRSFLRSLRSNFGFYLVFEVFDFHLEYWSFWVSRLFDLGDHRVLRMGSGIFFKNYIFEISAFKGKR